MSSAKFSTGIQKIKIEQSQLKDTKVPHDDNLAFLNSSSDFTTDFSEIETQESQLEMIRRSLMDKEEKVVHHFDQDFEDDLLEAQIFSLQKRHWTISLSFFLVSKREEIIIWPILNVTHLPFHLYPNVKNPESV